MREGGGGVEPPLVIPAAACKRRGALRQESERNEFREQA